MKHVCKIAAILICFSGIVMPGSMQAAGDDEREKIIFATTPWGTPEKLKLIHAPLMEYLSQTLGKDAVFRVAKNYQELAERIEANAVDVGLFPSNSYVQAKRKIPGLKYLVSLRIKESSGNFRDYYKGVIITLRSSPYRSLQDLQDTRFGFTDYQSTSGYVYPMALFRKRGIDPERHFSKVFMLKKHEKVLGALLKGSIDAGVIAEDILREAIQEHGELFHVILETAQIPYDAYAAGEHVPDRLCRQIQELLVNLPDEFTVLETPGHAAVPFPYRYVIRDDSFYDVVRDAYEQSE